MVKTIADGVQISDYSLLGKDAVLAVEKGLAGARWYTPPIPKDRMRDLLVRRDGPAIRDTLIWFILLAIFGACGYLLWGSWWTILPFAIYGVLYASVSDSRWHESGHGTAFKTDWMNNVLYEIASFMVLRESTLWRWSHTRHHSDTIIVGRDLEIAVQRPANLAIFFSNFINLSAIRKYIPQVILHSTGRLTAEELTFIPELERGKITVRARIYILIYAGVIAISIYFHSLLPLMYVGLPNLYGAWLTIIYGYTQHAGLAENVLDHRLNTRTVYMNALNRYLYWNMNYHLEHHMFPLVPYHALAKLHELAKPYTPPPYNGIIEAYQEILPTVFRQVKDSTYYVKRNPPAPTIQPAPSQASRMIVADNRPVLDGYIELCSSGVLEKEDVIRFDYGHQTYAMYRTVDGELFATDGICTHGNAYLSDGYLKGTTIECAKHNGRYDIRDGSPQRLPVCVGIKTYAVRERDGTIQVNLSSASGYGVTAPPTTHAFRVVSNDNVATFIKELVLEPFDGSLKLDFQPGDYLQFDIPVYPKRTLHAIDIKEPYASQWHAQQAFDHKAGNSFICRRNYSIASNPASDRLLSFNVRIALPPLGQDYPAGVGSVYLFGLKPGDKVTAVGPFGDFHIKNTRREMVYLGGGSGMAPLKSHLSSLFETQKTTRRISYWFGARSLKDLFYDDYFRDLASQYQNFTFEVALSEPLLEEKWEGSTGLIHDVLKYKYLDSHPDPTQIEYYLCGPPVMIEAATKMLSDLGIDPTQIAYDQF